MPPIDAHAPGSFCWVELETTDQAAAKTFYGSLFDWTAVDFPLGPTATYTIFQKSARDAAAAYSGTHPRWNLYISVENADETAARAEQLGATIAAKPFDVGANGRMAVIIDPTGAAFCLWQAKQTPGLGIMGEPNTYVWADLSTSGRPAAKQFYEALFGWKCVPGKGKDESTYLHIMNGDRGIAGILPDTHRNPNAPPHWTAYFMVADAAATAAKAKELGAKVLAPPMTVGESLRIAVLADPQGAVFSLFQS